MRPTTKSQRGPQLRLHRETLRQLSTSDLRAAGGGAYWYHPTTLAEQPKTNGWSSNTDAICGV